MRKLILIFSLLFAVSFAQVPNTTTFTLQNVKDNVSGASGNLSSCFSNAVSGSFDPTYNNDSYAPANSLLRFRNYGGRSFNWSYTRDSGFTGTNIEFLIRVNGTPVVDITSSSSGTLYVNIGDVIYVASYVDSPHTPTLEADLIISSPDKNISYTGHPYSSADGWTIVNSGIITVTGHAKLY